MTSQPGRRSARVRGRNLDGEFDDELELNPKFAAVVDPEVVEAENVIDMPNG
jgi:hypothetical protein